ncbi:MAG: hypothetical protein ACYTDY_09700 [Planctomycetota bacterium]
MAKASLKYVFVFLHQTREDSRPSYELVTKEYLEESFLHPVYFFLRPDGTELDKKHRHHHEALAGQQILKILQKIQKEWGPGLSIEQYEKAKADLAKADELLAAGDEDGAKGILEKLAKLKARCGVKDRAKAMLIEIELTRRLLEAWRKKEGVPPALGEQVAKGLSGRDLVAVFKMLRAAKPKPAPDPVGSFLDEVTIALREAIRLNPVRLDEVYIGTRTFYYLRAEWETSLSPFDGLVLQIGYVTDQPKTLEGWAVFDKVAPHKHHRAACSLSSLDLRLRDVANVRAQLWIGDFLLHESLLKKEPTQFPEEQSHVTVGPDLLRVDETLGVSSHSRLREYNVGRYHAGKQ